jgi:hypothetical protein
VARVSNFMPLLLLCTVAPFNIIIMIMLQIPWATSAQVAPQQRIQCPATVLPHPTPCPATPPLQRTPCPPTVLQLQTPCPATVLPQQTQCPATVLPQQTQCQATVLPRQTRCPATVLRLLTQCPATAPLQRNPSQITVLPLLTPLQASPPQRHSPPWMHNPQQQCLRTSLLTAPRHRIHGAALTLPPLLQKHQPLRTPQVRLPIAGSCSAVSAARSRAICRQASSTSQQTVPTRTCSLHECRLHPSSGLGTTSCCTSLLQQRWQ